jgi:hypothetical protein
MVSITMKLLLSPGEEWIESWRYLGAILERENSPCAQQHTKKAYVQNTVVK